jgi:haloalkane dehalogenase
MGSVIAAPSLPGWLEQALPFGRKALRLRGGPDEGRVLHFLDHGVEGGRAVFLQHGNPTWSYLWRKVMRLLDPDTFRCVAPDLLGFGLSSTLPRLEDHSVERHADALGQLIEALGLREVILVGQDWGGPLVASLGARYPGRVAGLVLANTSVLLPARPKGTKFHRFARMPVVSELAFRVGGFPLWTLHQVQGDPSSISGEVAQAYRWPLRSVSRRVAPLALARMVPDGPDHPSVPALRRGEAWARSFGGPMSLVWGVRDPVLGKALRWHEEAFPLAPVTLTQAGHFLQEEVPGSLASAIISVHQRLQGSPRGG